MNDNRHDDAQELAAHMLEYLNGIDANKPGVLDPALHTVFQVLSAEAQRQKDGLPGSPEWFESVSMTYHVATVQRDIMRDQHPDFLQRREELVKALEHAMAYLNASSHEMAERLARLDSTDSARHVPNTSVSPQENTATND